MYMLGHMIMHGMCGHVRGIHKYVHYRNMSTLLCTHTYIQMLRCYLSTYTITTSTTYYNYVQYYN